MKEPLEIMEDTQKASEQAYSATVRAEKSVRELAQEQKTMSSTLRELKEAVNGSKSFLEGFEQRKLNQTLLSLKILCTVLILALVVLWLKPSSHCFWALGGELIFQNEIFYCAYR